MSTSMLLGLFSWIGDFFKSMFDLIPKIIYLFWASLSCVLDVLQLFFRKLAGLDVYYMTENGKTTMIAGDIVTQFIAGILGWDIGAGKYNYSTLSTVFYSMILFGIIVCFGCILIAIIKSHYSYDEKSAKGPMQYVYAGVKSVVNMVAVPVIVVLGLYVSQALLQALDSITSTGSTQIEALYGQQTARDYLLQTATTRSAAENTTNSAEKTYSYYDIFGAYSNILYGTFGGNAHEYTVAEYGRIAATTETFSGSMFKVAAYNANRVRTHNYTLEAGYTCSTTLFQNAKNSEDLANMIDTAFGNNLHLKTGEDLNYSINGGPWVSDTYFTNFLTWHVKAFSKFNVGLVWYYYDLWEFNFLVGFASIIVGASLFVNIIMGLITRLFMCVGLFLISPPLFGLAPLDGGKATKSWRENFMKQVLMTYGAVVGMNIFFLMLPYFNKISFFNIEIADYFAQTLIIIVGLITIKAFIAVCSALIGAEDANASGQKIAGEVGGTIKGAAKMTGAAAKFAYKHTPAGMAVHAGVSSAKMGLGKLKDKIDSTEGGHKFLSGAGKAFAAIKDPNSAVDAGLNWGWNKMSKVAEKKKVKKEKEALGKVGDVGSIEDKVNKFSVNARDIYDGVKNGSMSDGQAIKKMMKDHGFNKAQSKEMLNQIKNSEDHGKFFYAIREQNKDDGSNVIFRGKGKMGFKGMEYEQSAFEKGVRKPYQADQAGFIKANEASWNRAKAVGSSGIGEMGNEAFKNILKGDTFKWADDVRSKKKEDAAKGREQQRHSEEMDALRDIANILKSQNKKP